MKNLEMYLYFDYKFFLHNSGGQDQWPFKALNTVSLEGESFVICDGIL